MSRPPEVPHYTRPVSFNERLYLGADRAVGGYCIQIVLEGGTGAIDLDALGIAVERAAAQNPGSRLVLRGALGTLRWEASGPNPAIRVVEGWDGDGPPPVGLVKPLSPVTGPTCELVVCSGVTQRLVLRCNHAVMDARGLLFFAEEVFRALRGEPLLGSVSNLTDSEFIVSQVGARKRPRVKMDRRTVTSARATDAGLVASRAFSLDQPAPALTARIAVAIAEYAARFHAGAMRVMIPVDLRQYDRSLRSTGNLTGALFFDVASGLSWLSLHRDILKRLASKEPMALDPMEPLLRWLPLWLLAMVHRLAAFYHRRSGNFPMAALITHVSLKGLVPFVAGAFASHTARFLPPEANFIPLGVWILSSAQVTHVAVTAPRNLLPPRELSTLAEEIKACSIEDSVPMT